MLIKGVPGDSMECFPNTHIAKVEDRPHAFFLKSPRPAGFIETSLSQFGDPKMLTTVKPLI